MTHPPIAYRPDEAFARELDAADPLGSFPSRFCPLDKFGGWSDAPIYLCSNSLGLMPKAAQGAVEQELTAWARRGHHARFVEPKGWETNAVTPKGDPRSWYNYHQGFRESCARLVGAEPGEVVMMNALSVNLHLLLVSFYRPTPERFKIVTDHPTFPSDNHIVRTHMASRGFDPEAGHVRIRPRAGEHILRTEDVVAWIREHGSEVALVMMAGVNFVTGQFHDIAAITAAAQEAGCVCGWDLAHAAGNVEMKLHDWNVDFAAWCTYKYLSAGPGGVGGAFVHSRHRNDSKMHRFAGWWGEDPVERLHMDVEAEFVAQSGAEGWQISNPPIFTMAPLRASMDLYDEAGMPAFREKSRMISGYIEYLIRLHGGNRVAILTPPDWAARGCQVSFTLREEAAELNDALEHAGVICDFREPNVIRVAPTPFLNTYHEVWRFGEIFKRALANA